MTFDQIKELTFGAVNIEEQADGLHFYKCTKKQIDVWNKKWKVLGERAAGSTGITIDFETDADTVIFDVKGAKFEVLLNRVLFGQYLFEDHEFHKIELKLSGEKTRVTLVLPSHDDGGVIRGMDAENASFLVPHQFDCKMLFLGDSITQGWNAKYNCLSYAYQVADHLNAERVINGIGGAYYLAESFDKIDFDPDIVIVAYGVNDYLHYKDLPTFESNLVGFLEQVKENYGEKKVFVTLPIHIFRDVVNPMGDYDFLRNVIQKTALNFGFRVLDGYRFVPYFEDFYADDLHPNDLGFSVYARKMIEALE